MPKNVVKVEKGQNGWGGPLFLSETETLKVVASITGGGIHPVAQKIADLLNVEAIDGFNSKVEPSEMICAVIDCGGTARCGVYPKLGVNTIDVHAITPSGPLMKFMKEDIFVSGVTVDTVKLEHEHVVEVPLVSREEKKAEIDKLKAEVRASRPANKNGLVHFINKIGRSVGGVVGIFYQAARDTIDIVLKNIIPFMAFISMVIGLITYTGIGDIIANAVKPLAGNVVGMVILAFICAIPFISPVLGPGAAIASVVGVLIGVEIGNGNIDPTMSLPALFAINSQVGADFIPVGLTLAEAEPETVEIGVPAVLFSRMITGPIAVIIAWLASFGMY
ncbi:MAG TPA: PTS glucitol/sorbitol transporter subunit IIB [Erysipelothrix sp.]|jgi:PTS system glucitol/sorbitol-specific IIC component|nr:PTS glucitol/sorbitol transporter subunit IIB [Erysipelothrix sp.]